MTEPENTPAPVRSYWYRADAERTRAVEVLEALRRFRAADSAMRQRAQADMEMNETDLAALRHLISAEARGRAVSPKDLSAHLGVSSAATAKLLARLVGSGHVRREVNPRDHRAQLLHTTPVAHEELRRTLGDMHRRMLEVAGELTGAQQSAVIHFLDSLGRAVGAPGDPSGTGASGTEAAGTEAAGSLTAGAT